MHSSTRVHSLWRCIEIFSSNGVLQRRFPIDDSGRLIIFKNRNKRRNLQEPNPIPTNIPNISPPKFEQTSQSNSSSENSPEEYSFENSNSYFQEILQMGKNDKNCNLLPENESSSPIQKKEEKKCEQQLQNTSNQENQDQSKSSINNYSDIYWNDLDEDFSSEFFPETAYSPYHSCYCACCDPWYK